MTATTLAAQQPRRTRSRRPRGRATGWLFITPNLIGFLAFTLLPLIAGVVIAFTDWNVVSGLDGISFVGLSNFQALLVDQRFWSAVGRTVLYAGLGVPLTMLGGLTLAMALNGPVVGRGVLRLIFFFPHIVNQIAVGFVWLLLLHPAQGVVNIGLSGLGIEEPPSWLVSQDWSLLTIILITSWAGMGFHCVIFLSALQSVPPELHEAAQIDGAGWWRRFKTVTLPSLMPTITFLGIMSMISHSQGFGLIAFLTQGGPGDSSTTLSYYMYQRGFQFYQFGYAAAIGVLNAIGVLGLTIFMWRFQRGKGLYS